MKKEDVNASFRVRPENPLLECALVKRIFDILFSGIALILSLPLTIVVVLWIKWDSRGPILFKQERVGLKQKPFVIFKFRTMFVAQSDKSLLTRKNDSRITRCGKILRKLSLDEIPNLYNVLIGDMSIVGPRPEVPSIVKKDYKKWMYRVFDVKPGMTGLSQINGRQELDLIKKNRIDLTYVKNQNLWLDILIILKTIPVVLRGIGNR